MAANCVQDLEAAVKAVKDEYGNDPKWSNVIQAADKVVAEAHSAEGSDNQAPPSPGKQAAEQVHNQIQESKAPEMKPESPSEEKAESPAHENAESDKVEKTEHPEGDPKDMKGAAKIALLMLRKK